MRRNVKIALALLLFVFWGVVAASFYLSGMPSLIAFVRSQSESKRICKIPIVLDALSAVVSENFDNRVKISAQLAREFSHATSERFQYPSADTFTLLQRKLWLSVALSSRELGAGYCAAGAAGKDYDFEYITHVVGMEDPRKISGDALRALAKLYVYDINWRMPSDEIRQRYSARLRTLSSAPRSPR